MTVVPPHLLTLLLLAAVTVTSATAPPFPPTMVKLPPRQVLYTVPRSPDDEYRPFLLECEAVGDPEPSYKWSKNGHEFHLAQLGDRITQQRHRGSLVFAKPNEEDEGLYQCNPTNPYGTTVSNTVWVRRAHIGEFASGPPKTVRVVEGMPLSLYCEPPVGGYPPPILFWVSLHTNGALRSLISARITVDPQGTLHFAWVEPDDQFSDGVYACAAATTFRHEYKIVSKIQLEVEPKQSVGKTELAPVHQYVSPPTQKVLRGQTLRLYCIYGGKPLPQITWTKQGSGSLAPTERLTYDNVNKTLEIKSVSFEDEGTYECQASNGVGADQIHAMQVKVEAEPYWLSAPSNTIAAEGQSARFECVAAGVPEPELQWFVNGVPMESAEANPRRKVEGPVLSIEPLAMSDTAVYQCNASNPHGYAFRDFYLNVAGV